MSTLDVPNSLLPGKGLINGEWVDARDGNTFAVKNPATGAVIGVVPDMGAADTEAAINSAYAAFQKWSEMPARERGKILRKWGELIVENQDNLAKILTAENGKPFAEARDEVGRCFSFLEWFAEEGRRAYGDVVPSPAPTKRLVFIKQPVGVAGLITPWNFPAAMVARKASAALAAGCTSILKPAEDTPLVALGMAKLAVEAGMPPGVFNVVTCSRSNAPIVGKTLCESPLVAKISFTGSTVVGKKLLEQSASTVKKVSLELGGNAPFIVFNSAKLDLAVKNAVGCKFRGSGQTCISANRFLVQNQVYDEFCAKLTSEVKKFVVGDGMASGTTQGPLINERGLEKVERHVRDALENGGKILVGGNRHSLGKTFFEPTVISGATTKAAVFREETFGPVAVVTKFTTEEEALAIANNCRQGLAGYFFSQDISQVWRVAERMEVGMVGINDCGIAVDEIAFGGVKESGLGREGSKYGLDDYMHIKYLCFGNL